MAAGRTGKGIRFDVTAVYRRRSLHEVRAPALVESLRAWRSIGDRRGNVNLLADSEGLLSRQNLTLPASVLMLVDGDNPLDYMIAWHGAGIGVYRGSDLIGRQLGALPDQAYAAEAGRQFTDTLDEREVAYHEAVATIDGKLFHYDRLLLPILANGRVTALLTVAHWRTPAPPQA